MNWLALAQTLIPIAIQIAEAKHGDGNGPAKNDTATIIVRGTLDMVGNAIGKPAPPEIKDRSALGTAISAAVQAANALGGVQKH